MFYKCEDFLKIITCFISLFKFIPQRQLRFELGLAKIQMVFVNEMSKRLGLYACTYSLLRTNVVIISHRGSYALPLGILKVSKSHSRLVLAL